MGMGAAKVGIGTVASHSDTTATGAELEELTDGSETTLHSHVISGGFVDRGDPDAPDFTLTDFTANSAYHDLNLSSIVPAGVKAVLFYINIKDNLTNSYMIFRQNGKTDVNNVAILRTQVANIAIDSVMVIACDTDRVIEYLIPTGTIDAINMTIGGWWL